MIKPCSIRLQIIAHVSVGSLFRSKALFAFIRDALRDTEREQEHTRDNILMSFYEAHSGERAVT